MKKQAGGFAPVARRSAATLPRPSKNPKVLPPTIPKRGLNSRDVQPDSRVLSLSTPIFYRHGR